MKLCLLALSGLSLWFSCTLHGQTFERPATRQTPAVDTTRSGFQSQEGSTKFTAFPMQRPEDSEESNSDNLLRVGLAETDITPPIGFPIAGYYHERLAEGTIDPLKAKAIVFRGQEEGALVICDLIGITTDLSREVRRLASEKTGIAACNIVVAATHSHTAPDYVKELYLYLGEEPQAAGRAEYIEQLIHGVVDAITQAHERARPMALAAGSTLQATNVSFNRRFVMRDGSVLTWQSHSNPDVVKAAGPIDPEIGILAMRDPESGELQGIINNFSLHLDTVSGMRWSADFPFFIERKLRQQNNPQLLSLFATGCCGDINHSDPTRKERNKVDFIGNALAETISAQIPHLRAIDTPQFIMKSQVVELPLQKTTREQVARSVEILKLVQGGSKVHFLDHVRAYKELMLDHLLHYDPFVETADYISWGLSRSLAGVGDTLPVDVSVMAIGHDTAIVCLPGEVFVDLGLAIKQASPYRTTILVELSNTDETIYIPHRAAYAGGSYEVTNSTLQPGGGELLVEAAVELLRQSAAESAD
ncbi:neutral/alkaline non-lysosomal ceramidase N-terminal domain-containing protein [Aureliella helgolandensis]|uniref:Neutral ceramidase n=1 Tax=Aureliella helgolandensis TaxID=2527968 RepID=A0A518GA62_9BACT|nr:neutral/alkaline non-lysosomal ceramidase N-terminal domain-containing protein [Aureliella helgolandensis]QDV25474.1 Neutral ceramidase precursor [Aureliella helgolandensis]